MEKNTSYWEIHKEEYQKIFDELEPGMKTVVTTDSRSLEAHSLDLLVERAVRDRLKKIKKD